MDMDSLEEALPVVVVQWRESEWAPGSRHPYGRLALPPFPSIQMAESNIKVVVQKLYYSDVTGYKFTEYIERYTDTLSCHLPGIDLILADEELNLILDPEVPWEDRSISVRIRADHSEELSFYSRRDEYRGRRKNSKISHRKVVSRLQEELSDEEVEGRNAINIIKQISLKIGYYPRLTSINYFDDIEIHYDYAYLSASQFWSLFPPHPHMSK